MFKMICVIDLKRNTHCSSDRCLMSCLETSALGTNKNKICENVETDTEGIIIFLRQYRHETTKYIWVYY